jgi:DNA polymerase III epsilon subunit-like protein
MYLIFDTETAGLPANYDAPHADVGNWPRLVQLAWKTFDKSGSRTNSKSFVIRPVGYEIPVDAQKIHGISTTIARRNGVPVAQVLEEFMDAINKSEILVAHNLRFDTGILGAEFYRIGSKKPFERIGTVCTMEVATDYCALPGRRGHKWPKLEELHHKLFGKKVKETHDADADATTCAKCFFELKRLGIISLPKKGTRRRR